MAAKIDLVFRTMGERTSALALDLARENIRPDQVHVLENVTPFWRAVHQSLSLPLKGDVVVFMDADCLILQDMRPFLDANTCAHVDAGVLDKFRGWVPAGVHITRMDLVQAMRGVRIDRGDPEYFLKPESWLRRRALIQMDDHELLKRLRILHDFEQDYEHIFVKYVTRDLRSRKSHKRISLDRKMAAWDNQDPDCLIARRAVEYARRTVWPASGREMCELLPGLPEIARQELQNLRPAHKPALDRAAVERLCGTPQVCAKLQACPVKIFGLGLSAVALKNLARALEALGFNVAPNVGPGFMPAMPGAPAARLPAVEDFDGVAGVNLAGCYRQLDAAYPEARFILVTGRQDEWMAEVKAAQGKTPGRFATSLAQVLQVNSLAAPECSSRWLAQAYQAYHQQVEDHFREHPGKLVCVDPAQADGWAALCSFLGQPVVPAL